MTSAHLRLSRVSTSITIAFALAAFVASSAAAKDVLRLLAAVSHAVPGADRDKDRKGGGWIEIGSVQWGPARSGGKMHQEDISAAPSAGAKGGNVEFEWKVEEGESAPPRPGRPTDVTMKRGTSASSGVEREMKESGEKGGTEDINIGVGELQEAAGRRTHKPVKITKEWDASTPLLRQGSVTTLVPAGTCRLGARYPTAELGTGNRVYRMTNVVVTSCSASGSSAGDARPMESISLNYEKVVWN